MRQSLVPALWALLLAACCSLQLAGCATPRTERSYVVLLPSPDGTLGKVRVAGERGVQQIEQARFAAPLDGSQAPAPVDEARYQRDFAEALAARPELPQLFVLYFETGSTQLTPESQKLLPDILRNAAKRGSADLTLIGHSDSAGSAELNEGLSLRRAQAVAEWLKTQNLKFDTLTVQAQGKRRPLVPTPDERSEPRNRRVEVTVR
jgi:outer membrane protein OmpA-like peptidoglycan-associated protein